MELLTPIIVFYHWCIISGPSIYVQFVCMRTYELEKPRLAIGLTLKHAPYVPIS
jgi:hypothetical protein